MESSRLFAASSDVTPVDLTFVNLSLDTCHGLLRESTRSKNPLSRRRRIVNFERRIIFESFRGNFESRELFEKKNENWRENF